MKRSRLLIKRGHPQIWRTSPRLRAATGEWPRPRRLKDRTEGAPGPSLLGTGEAPALNWREEAHASRI